jgi:8-oxo-dGTP pyrophosphatase MutT (NUDIX family)
MTAETFQFAQKAFIARDRRILLVEKSSSDPENPGLWEVPGGRMEFGEDVDEHLRREVLEEVGLDVVPGAPIYVWQWVMPDRHVADGKVQVVAVARVCSAESELLTDDGRLDDDYLDDARWVPFDEVSNFNLIPSLRPAMSAFLRSQGNPSPT